MIWQNLTYGKNYAAIEHAENSIFQLLLLKKQKEAFVISNRDQKNDLHQVIDILKKQQHVFIIFNNEQVLTKKVAEIHPEEKGVLRLAFPTITVSDFYYETYQTNGNTFVAIARKRHVDAIILEYQKKGISIIDFSLGNLAIKNLQKIVSEKSLETSNAEIHFEAQHIDEIKKTTPINKTFVINDLRISNSEVLPLAGIVGYYTQNSSSKIQKKLKEDFIQKRIFDVGLKSGLRFLLLLLLVNFLAFSSYRNQVAEVTEATQMSEESKMQLASLQSKVAQKKQLVKRFQSTSNSKRSKYLDELGKTTPPTILLSQMSFQPIIGTQRADKKLLFDEKKLLISGACKKDTDFSAWVAVLEKKNWVQSISINDYGKGKKRGSISNFEFEITIYE
ncbi:hypothetical protein N9Q58_01035 [Polaribacter sp.]|nr:hypothetical protein [Polaribacter sp.]